MRHVSILMNAQTLQPGTDANERTAGFSDGWYDSGADDQRLLPKDQQLINLRAALLPSSSSVVGYRISQLDAYGRSTGKSRVYKMAVAGGESGETGDPRQALQYTCFSQGATNELQLYIQNPPAARIKTGSYYGLAAWETKIKAYIDHVAAAGYRFYAFDQTQPVSPIVGISALGVITLSRHNVYAPGNFVRALRCKTVLRGHFRANADGYEVATSDGLTVTVHGWDQGECTGGSLTLWEKYLATPILDAFAKSHPAVSTRKVGRPFFLFRGRASNRV